MLPQLNMLYLSPLYFYFIQLLMILVRKAVQCTKGLRLPISEVFV